MRPMTKHKQGARPSNENGGLGEKEREGGKPGESNPKVVTRIYKSVAIYHTRIKKGRSIEAAKSKKKHRKE